MKINEGVIVIEDNERVIERWENASGRTDCRMSTNKSWPIGLVTEIINKDHKYLLQKGYNNKLGAMVEGWIYYVDFRPATEQEKFLYILNGNIPFLPGEDNVLSK